jgi:hypothetical protein
LARYGVSGAERADQIRELCRDRLSASRVRVLDLASMVFDGSERVENTNLAYPS